MATLFREVSIEKVSDKIVQQLTNLIVEGKLKPGDKLPGERQLIEMLGVGRSSLREALNRLQTMGYIEIRTRQGNFVKSINSSFQMDPLKRIMQEDRKRIIHLYDIRCDIEKASAYEAATLRTEAQLADIQRCKDAFEKADEQDNCWGWDLDKAFHLAIATATNNFVRIHVVRDIFDFSQEFIEPIIDAFMGNREYTDATIEQHERLVEAIAGKKAELARARMDEHLSWAKVKMNDYFERRGK